MSKGRLFLVVLLIVASLGAYFPPVKSEQPWLSGREDYLFGDDLKIAKSFISKDYIVYITKSKKLENKEIFNIYSVKLSTGEISFIYANNDIELGYIDTFLISEKYFTWLIDTASTNKYLMCVNLDTKQIKKIADFSNYFSFVKIEANIICFRISNNINDPGSIYVFDFENDTSARKIIDLKPDAKQYYDAKTIIIFNNQRLEVIDLKTMTSKNIDVRNIINDYPELMLNYVNGYLLYISKDKIAYCYNMNTNDNIFLYKLDIDEVLFTEYNNNSRLMILTRFAKNKENPVYISHKQFRVFDTKTEKLYEVAPLFEMSEYCLARNNSSYENKLVFLHYVRGTESEKTNCVIEYMEFPDSKEEEPKKYYVADSNRRPCNLRSDPMICNGKIAYIEESLREEDNKEKIVIFSYEQKVVKDEDCKLIKNKKFDGNVTLEGSISNHSVVVQRPVDCKNLGQCSLNPKVYFFDTEKNEYDIDFDKESTIKDQPLICQQTTNSKFALLNSNGIPFYNELESMDQSIWIDLKNISAYATNEKYCCFYANKSTIYLSHVNNPRKFEKLFEHSAFEVEKMYIKGDLIFLQVFNSTITDSFPKRSFVVYDIPKKTKYIVENSEHPIIDGALRGDSLYYVVNMGSPGCKFNRHKLIKQKIGQDFQETLLQLYGYETLKIIDNPYSDTLCIQRDLTIGDGASSPVYESNVYILDPLENSMIEAFQSHNINDFSVLSYFGKTVAVIMEDENSFWAKLLTPNLGGDITEQEIPFVTSNSGFVNAQLTDGFLYVVTTDFVKREASYMAYSCK